MRTEAWICTMLSGFVILFMETVKIASFSHTQSCRSDRSLVTAACQEEATSFSYKCSDFSDGS
uniref:Uncharacterized protein n=1 Tax=Triticum urartu TaxID=4572 RepID=A0A8R7QZA7_TRIUA